MTADEPVIAVAIAAVVSFRFFIYDGNGGVTTSNVVAVPRIGSKEASYTIYQNFGVFNSAN